MAKTKTLSEAERQERREADRRRSEEAVQALLSSEGWKRWLACRRHFHRYSLANQLLIALQMPDASRVAGFRVWLKLGYCVRKGEHAVIYIWMPIPPTRKAVEAWREAGSPAGQEPRTRFRLGPVFDRSQVTELPPPAVPVPLDPPISDVEGDDLEWALEPLEELAAELGSMVVLELLPRDVGGYFDPSTKTIGLNARRPVNHGVKTLVHELGHALVRELDAPDGRRQFTYAEEELVVESIAFTVCGSIGLDTSGYSIPYLASWSQAGALETIERAARTIDDLASRIEAAVRRPAEADSEDQS